MDHEKGWIDIRKVLIVENVKILRDLLTEYYELKGFEVIGTSTGNRGIEIFSSEPESFDLLIVDWILPGLSGKKLIEKILRIKSNQKIVILTAYAEEESILLLIRSPNISILEKPFKLSELDEILYKIT